MKLLSTLILLSLTLAGNALAQDVQPKPLEPGQTIVTLAATEQMNLQQDQLQGSLRIEVDSKVAKDVQDKINKAMQAALALGKDYKDVKVSTGQYYVYQFDPTPMPVSVKDAKGRMMWKGNQTIDLKSKNSEQLLELAGKIQELGFVMNGLNYTLSPEQEEAYKDTLMGGALKKIQARAALAAKALGKNSYEIIEVNIDNPGMTPPMPMYKAARMEMSMAASADMSAPVAQSGEQAVAMTVNARVLLKP